MRYILGIVVTFIVLATMLFFSLKIWDIHLFDEKYLKDGWIIFGLAAVTTLVLAIILPFFFKPHRMGYDTDSGKVAQAKNNQ